MAGMLRMSRRIAALGQQPGCCVRTLTQSCSVGAVSTVHTVRAIRKKTVGFQGRLTIPAHIKLEAKAEAGAAVGTDADVEGAEDVAAAAEDAEMARLDALLLELAEVDNVGEWVGAYYQGLQEGDGASDDQVFASMDVKFMLLDACVDKFGKDIPSYKLAQINTPQDVIRYFEEELPSYGHRKGDRRLFDSIDFESFPPNMAIHEIERPHLDEPRRLF